MVDWEGSQKNFSPPFFETQKIFLPFQRAQKIFHSKIHSPTNLIGVKILTKIFPLKIFFSSDSKSSSSSKFSPASKLPPRARAITPFWTQKWYLLKTSIFRSSGYSKTPLKTYHMSPVAAVSRLDPLLIPPEPRNIVLNANFDVLNTFAQRIF